MTAKRILITGASGFVGDSLVSYLNTKNKIIAISRYNVNDAAITINTKEFFKKSGFNEVKKFKPEYIIHAAAAKDQSLISNLFFSKNKRKFNEKYTRRLIELFSLLNCKRFIFISTVGIYGSQSKSEEIINEQSKINLENNYTKSKFACEKILKNKIKNKSLVILRPTLIYGKKAKGNIQTLIKLIDKGFPLPLREVNNKRSLLYIYNFVSVIESLLKINVIENNEFIISDKEEISTSNLVQIICKYRSKSILFFKIPKFIYNLITNIPIIKTKIDQLIGSYRVDSSLIRKELKWEQPFNQKYAIRNSYKK